MKTINALLLFALIFAVNSALNGFDRQTCIAHNPKEMGGEGLQAFSLDFCRSTDLETESTGFYRCCFIKYEKDNQRQYHCQGVTNYGFWNIDETKSIVENALGKVEIDTFDCSASYLYVSLFLIFALLF